MMLPEMPRYIHVVPCGEEHEERYLEGYLCKCDARLEPVYGTIIVIHNSFDGREGVEWVKEFLKEQK